MGATRESPSLDDAAKDTAELDELRRRAYGPDADIFDDGRALARLIELELRHGACRGMPEPEPELEPANAGLRPEEPIDAPPGQDDAGRGRTDRRRHRRAAAVIATGAAGVALFATVASGLGAGSSEATLYPRMGIPAAAAEELERTGDLRYLGIDQADVQLYDEFRGMNVWSARRGPQTVCLFITSTRSRAWGVDCRPWDRTPTITLTKYRDTEDLADGEPFRGAPVGTKIRFVLRDGAVQAVVDPVADDATAR